MLVFYRVGYFRYGNPQTLWLAHFRRPAVHMSKGFRISVVYGFMLEEAI